MCEHAWCVQEMTPGVNSITSSGIRRGPLGAQRISSLFPEPRHCFSLMKRPFIGAADPGKERPVLLKLVLSNETFLTDSLEIKLRRQEFFKIVS